MPPHAIVLQNASNLRDLGGWRGHGGRRVRRGRVFRGPALAGLAPEDQAAIAALGLMTVCDLRGADECRLHPVEIPGATRHALPVAPWTGPSLGALLASGKTPGAATADGMMKVLRGAYRTYPLDHAPRYRAVFNLLQLAENLPLLLHCSAGKDRTGFGAALILAALGVAWGDIVEDYLATNRLWRRELMRGLSLPDDVKEVLLGAHEALLESAFDALRAAHGSLDAYLAGPMGLDDAARRRLEALLLD